MEEGRFWRKRELQYHMMNYIKIARQKISKTTCDMYQNQPMVW